MHDIKIVRGNGKSLPRALLGLFNVFIYPENRPSKAVEIPIVIRGKINCLAMSRFCFLIALEVVV